MAIRRLLESFGRQVEPGERVASLDALRGFTILVMIFVNDVAGVRDAPSWMKHLEPPGADGMTFVDVVFPAFLFIVGMSIPMALERRFERGESSAAVWIHILARTVSLLVIGVFMVNTEHLSREGLLHPSLWTLLMYVGVILVWMVPPTALRLSKSGMMRTRAAGAALLIVLAVVYRGPSDPQIIELRPYWWGILGIIGWSYLAACAAYMLVRRDTTALIGAMVLLYGIYFAHSMGYFAGFPIPSINLGSIGSHGALTISGVVLGVMLMSGSPLKTHGQRIRWALMYGAALAATAHLLHSGGDIHRAFIINKIYATIPWSLWSAAITVWIWTATYAVLDIAGQRRWSMLLEHSGQNALLAYIMAPIFYAGVAYTVFMLETENVYAGLGQSFVGGFLRAVVFAFAVVWAAAWLRRRGILLKL